jgi:peptidylprolyl isomerase
MAEAKNGDTVEVHYTGKLQDGTVFDSSMDREPLSFTLGEGNMIQGFEKAVLGMQVGDTKTATLSPEEAYGERNETMIVEIPKENVPPNIDPQVGQQLAIQQPDGRNIPVTVTIVDDQKVVLDANHPLAGKDLVFEIELMSIS